MKTVLLFFTFVAITHTTAIILKDNAAYYGDIICQKRGALVLKSGKGTITILKKSIAFIDSMSNEGLRSLIIPDSQMVVNKNELSFINESPDTATIRLRHKETDSIVAEGVGIAGDTILFLVPNGTYYETIRYHRQEDTYYLKGHSFTLSTSCGTFAKQEITIKGYSGSNVPKLKSLKDLFERP